MQFFKYPPDALQLELLLKTTTRDIPPSEIFCAIEQVWAFPGDSGRAAFSFGFNYGTWNSLLVRNEIDYEEVRPRKWQSYFETPKMDKKERKRWLKDLAIKYAEEYKNEQRVTFNVSDAILIAIYGRYLYEDRNN